jgi:hypothetical protein
MSPIGVSVQIAARTVSAPINQADDRTGSFETTKRREVTPVSLLFTAKHRSKGEIILLCQKKT